MKTTLDIPGTIHAIHTAVGNDTFTINDVRNHIQDTRSLRTLCARGYLIRVSRSHSGGKSPIPTKYRIATASSRVKRLLCK